MWRDTTSYTQGQRGVKKPTSWSISIHELRITVTCGHIAWEGAWVMHCPTLNMREIELVGCENSQEAKLRAIVIVKDKLTRLRELADSAEV